MLRILGIYGLGEARGSKQKALIDSFEIKSVFTKFIRFVQGGIFISFEVVNSNRAKNYYRIDKKSELACFIVGNIYSYEGVNPEILSGTDIAGKVISLYKKNKKNILKLRGEFNIIIVDKDKLLLVNDRLGVSSLYLLKNDSSLVFCTSADPLVGAGQGLNLDFGSMAKFLYYGFVPDGKTFIKGLINQPAGTIAEVSQRGLEISQYATFRKLNSIARSNSAIIELAKEKFFEAVRIRAADSDCHFLELSGGWDTRFILGNILELGKTAIAFTKKNKKEEDYLISRKVAANLSLRHIVRSDFQGSPFFEHEFLLRFKCAKTIPDDYGQDGLFNFSWDELVKLDFFTSPFFAGSFGTELFGYVPILFYNRIKADLNVLSMHIFDKRFLAFLDKTERGWNRNDSVRDNSAFSPAYCFLNQIARAYLNTHYVSGWERPTHVLNYLRKRPFIDSDFATFLSSLSYDKYMYYKLYSLVFEKYYPALFAIPFTRTYLRKNNDLRKASSRTNNALSEEKNKLINLLKTEQDFREFLKNNRIIQKSEFVISNRLKELYFLHKWVNAYKLNIDKSDLKLIKV